VTGSLLFARKESSATNQLRQISFLTERTHDDALIHRSIAILFLGTLTLAD